LWGDNNQVFTKIFEEVDQINERFGRWEKIKEIRITPDVWSVDGGQLTPTMKLKRKVLKEKYQVLINSIYVA
jgi:long-chain acyl-CoA synthetase